VAVFPGPDAGGGAVGGGLIATAILSRHSLTRQVRVYLQRWVCFGDRPSRSKHALTGNPKLGGVEHPISRDICIFCPEFNRVQFGTVVYLAGQRRPVAAALLDRKQTRPSVSKPYAVSCGGLAVIPRRNLVNQLGSSPSARLVQRVDHSNAGCCSGEGFLRQNFPLEEVDSSC
jgi:hypothetical protein